MAKGDKAAKAVKKDEVKEEAVKKDEVPVESPNEEKKDETEEVAKEEVKKEEVKADEEKETSKTDETAEVKKDEDAAATKDDANEVKKEDESKKEGDMEVDGGGNGEKKEEAPAENKKKRGRKPKTESPAITPDPNKRLRRSSQTVTYQPEDFKSVTHTVQIFRGRGTKLKDLEAVRTSMDRFTRSSEEMHNAHRFLFTMRGKVPQAQVKGNILEFNGFLKYFDKDKVEKETMDKEDEEAESKFSTKAFKLTIPQIKQLCDFFNIDRSVGKDDKPLDKEALVDRLLDFLGAPSEKLLAAPIKEAKPASAKKAKKTTPSKTTKADSSAKKKKRGPNKKTKKAKDSDDEDEDDEASKEETVESEGEAVVAVAGSSSSSSAFAALKNYKKGEQPSDEVLREWVRAYIACFNMETSTAKHAIKTASEKFGLDLTEQKEKIKEMLTEEM